MRLADTRFGMGTAVFALAGALSSLSSIGDYPAQKENPPIVLQVPGRARHGFQGKNLNYLVKGLHQPSDSKDEILAEEGDSGYFAVPLQGLLEKVDLAKYLPFRNQKRQHSIKKQVTAKPVSDMTLFQRVNHILKGIESDPKSLRKHYIEGLGSQDRKEDSIEDQIQSSAKRYGLDPKLSYRIAKKESNLHQLKNGKPYTSKAGAVGLYQIMRENAAFEDMFDVTYNPGRHGAEKNMNPDVFSYIMNVIKPNLEHVLGGRMSRDIESLYIDRSRQLGVISSAKTEIRKSKKLRKKKGDKSFHEKLSKNLIRLADSKKRLKRVEKGIDFFLDAAWERVRWDYYMNSEIGNAYHGFLAIKANKGNRNLTPKSLAYSLSCANAGERHVRKWKGVPRFKETKRYVKEILNGYLSDKGVIVAVPGATPYGISKKYGIPLKDFVQMNGLNGKNMLAGNVYRIREGADRKLIAFSMPNFK